MWLSSPIECHTLTRDGHALPRPSPTLASDESTQTVHCKAQSRSQTPGLKQRRQGHHWGHVRARVKQKLKSKTEGCRNTQPPPAPCRPALQRYASCFKAPPLTQREAQMAQLLCIVLILHEPFQSEVSERSSTERTDCLKKVDLTTFPRPFSFPTNSLPDRPCVCHKF